MRPANKTVLVVTPLFPSNDRPYYCIYLLQLFEALKAYGYDIHVLMPDSVLADGEIQKDHHRDFTLIHVGHCNKLPNEILGKMSRGFTKSAKKILAAIKPDIIDLNLCDIAISSTFISLAKQFGARSVVHYHGLNVFYNFHIAHPWLEKVLACGKVRVCNRADGIVGVSNKIGQIVKTKSKNKAVYTVYNGVDADLFYPTQLKKNPVFTIACVANLIPIKGHAYLLQAARNVIFDHGHPLKVKLIGNGPERNRLEKLSEELGIADCVEFLGEQHYDVVAEALRSANFFIMPSYFESLGCVYLEAMASKTATLGVRGCGIDEIIIDKENGYLVDPRNAEQIEECILYAIKNPELHNRIAQKGYDTVTGKYLWSDAGSALDQVYRTLLQESAEYA